MHVPLQNTYVPLPHAGQLGASVLLDCSAACAALQPRPRGGHPRGSCSNCRRSFTAAAGGAGVACGDQYPGCKQQMAMSQRHTEGTPEVLNLTWASCPMHAASMSGTCAVTGCADGAGWEEQRAPSSGRGDPAVQPQYQHQVEPSMHCLFYIPGSSFGYPAPRAAGDRIVIAKRWQQFVTLTPLPALLQGGREGPGAACGRGAGHAGAAGLSAGDLPIPVPS